MRISLIVAADQNDVIGLGGALPWHLPEDLKRFRALTTGHVVIAGRKTQESIVARLGHPLPGRTTIVVTRRNDAPDGEVLYAADVASALDRAAALERGNEVFVIGGAQIYEAALPRVERVYLTRVHDTVQGDTTMPTGWLKPFHLLGEETRAGFTFQTYERRRDVSLYYLGNSRTENQLADMRRLEAAGICLFCPEHLAKDPDQRIAHRTAHWTITPNEFPYTGTRLHLLFVPDEHVTDMADLSSEAQRDFWTALTWVRDHYELAYYSLAARNGDCEFTGGTIRHVHVHLLQGDVADPDHQPVRTKLSSRPRGVHPDQLHPGRP